MRDYDILLFCVSCNVIEGPLWLDGYQLKKSLIYHLKTFKPNTSSKDNRYKYLPVFPLVLCCKQWPSVKITRITLSSSDGEAINIQINRNQGYYMYPLMVLLLSCK